MSIVTIPLSIIIGFVIGSWIVGVEDRIGTGKAWLFGMLMLIAAIGLLNVVVALIWKELGL